MIEPSFAFVFFETIFVRGLFLLKYYTEKSGGGKKDASGKEKMGCMKKDTKKFEK